MKETAAQQLEAAAKCIDVKDDGPVVQAVIFLVERQKDTNKLDPEDDSFGLHVKVLGEADGDLLSRYHVLSSAMAALHDEMDAMIEELDEILSAPPEPPEPTNSSERLS
jgi:hypothetical protein